MNVVLFKDLTTDEHLTELEANAEEYNGLYVDMEVSEQRNMTQQEKLSLMLRKLLNWQLKLQHRKLLIMNMQSC